MERGVLGNWARSCGAGEKPEITSNAYLLLRLKKEGFKTQSNLNLSFKKIEFGLERLFVSSQNY